jgi:hypothetical protein
MQKRRPIARTAPLHLPKFLIIGAMKAGTTSLYEDLTQVRGIYMCSDKEPNDLIAPDIETPAGRARYAAKFAGAKLGDLCGEASTAYAKRPTYNGVAARARALLGADLRVIYLRRDPIKRMVSQYHHLWGLGLEQRPMREALLNDTTYLDYSRYDWQLEPWRAEFPDAQILVLDFEDYIANRAQVLAQVCQFLNCPAPPALNPTHRNASEGKRVTAQGSWQRRIRDSNFYLYRLKPLLPTRLRDKIKSVILPKAKTMTEGMDHDLRAELGARLATYKDQDSAQ